MRKPKHIDIEELRQYENKWVALLRPEERIVASGNDAHEAAEEARKHGYTDFILWKILPFDTVYVPLA